MKLKIGHLEVKVILDSKYLGDEIGKFDDRVAELHVAGDLGEREFVATLIHEILHAITYSYGLRATLLKEQDDEEHICEVFGNGLAQAFCENKSLINLLKEKITNGR